MFLMRGVKLSYASIALEGRVKEYSKNNFLEKPLTLPIIKAILKGDVR